MPSQVAATPMPAATAAARTGPLVTRSAVAAGPISSAVLSTAPMTTADSATETASAIRKAAPTARTGTPRAAARSGLSELSSSTRASAEGQVAPELVQAHEEGARSPGGGDVGQRVAGERLAAGHREHAGHGRGDRDDGADGQRDVHRPAAEEAGLDDVAQETHRITPASSAAASAASMPSGAATTRTRPCTLITSTCWPYSRDRTSGWTTSSAVPTATRPAAT